MNQFGLDLQEAQLEQGTPNPQLVALTPTVTRGQNALKLEQSANVSGKVHNQIQDLNLAKVNKRQFLFQFTMMIWI